jgi:hypothetical protein
MATSPMKRHLARELTIEAAEKLQELLMALALALYERWRDLWDNPGLSDSRMAAASTATWFRFVAAAVVHAAYARQSALVRIPLLLRESVEANDHEDPDSWGDLELPRSNRRVPVPPSAP